MSDRITKQRVLAHLLQQTEKLDFTKLNNFTAAEIAKQLGVSRTLVSQYLNESLAEGLVIKVNTRPVYFFALTALADSASFDLLEGVYDSVESLKEMLQEQKNKKSAFDRLIGSAGSLSYNVEQCKAAISYPGNGLPILILGPTGCGKSYLAGLMFDYTLEKGIIRKDKQFVSVNCAEYANNPELFLTNFFGFKKGAYTGADRDRKGLVSLADGGVLFLDEIHCLSFECQEKLFHFMDKGVYHMVGDNEKWYGANVRMIMATTEDPKTALLKTLVRRIPIITRISALSERPVQEKKELLFHLIRREAIKIKKEVRLSSRAYQALVNYRFEENVGLLVNCIRTCVANVYQEALDYETQYIDICLHHMPDYILKTVAVKNWRREEESLMDVNDIQRELKTEKKLFVFNLDIVRQFQRIVDEDGNTEDVFSISQTRYEQYINDTYHDHAMEKNPKESLYTEMVKDICAGVGKRLGVDFYNHDILNLSRLICDYIFNGASCASLGRKYYETIQIALAVYQKRAKMRNNQIIGELSKELSMNLGVEISPLGMLNLYICLSAFSSWIKQKQAAAIVLARGEEVASAIAKAANQRLEHEIFSAIDVGFYSTLGEISSYFNEFLAEIGEMKDVLLITDIEEIEDFQKAIGQIGNRNLGIISNISSSVVIQAGKMILNNMQIREILEQKDKWISRHEVYYEENRKKLTAILAVCKTGMGTAERISDLLGESLSKHVDIPVIPYDYNSLSNAGLSSPVFEKYSILFIVGTNDPKVEGIRFISLEDIIQQRNAGEINELLSSVMSNSQLRSFNQSLMKNFSLTNLVEHLTVLNPEKVIDFAEDIVRKLQTRTGVALKNNVIIGLYVHISCMIERLMTDKNTVLYEGVAQFQNEHDDFISMVRECFEQVEKYYGVTIPVEEIGYLYEYVYNL